MKKIFLTIIALSIITLICCESSSVSDDKTYQLSVKNDYALELYNSAKLKSQRGDYSGSKADYEAALRIEPNFIMACLEIPENNIVKKKQYMDRVLSNLETATDTEKIFYELSGVLTKDKREELLLKLIKINPKNSNAHASLGIFYRNNGKLKKAIEYLNNSIKINPKNWLAHRTIFGIKYPGYGDPEIGPFVTKNDNNFFNFSDSLKVFENDIEKLIKIDTLNVAVFRKIGDMYRSSKFINKAKEYYLKGVEVCNYNANSYRSELMHVAGNATFLMGNVEESIKYFQESLDIEFDPYLKMKRIFQLATVYLYDQDHANAIKVLDDFELNLKRFGFNQSEVNQAAVSINSYKSFFYADMGNKKMSYDSWNNFIKYADIVLEEIPDFNNSYVQKRNSQIGVASGLNDRLDRITSENRELDFIWLSLLNNDLSEAKNLIDKSNLDDSKLVPFIFIHACLSRDINAVNSIIENGYEVQGNRQKFYYSKLLIDKGEKKKAMELLENIANGRFFSWGGGLFRKKSQELFKEI